MEIIKSLSNIFYLIVVLFTKVIVSILVLACIHTNKFYK